MFSTAREQIQARIDGIRAAGLYKQERVMLSPQSAHVDTSERKRVVNMCANNYLGLADHPDVIEAAHDALNRWGYGLASVRFICGTQQIHKDLERRISDFLGTEDTILYSSCFDANGGLFETLLEAEDVIVSDELNHASVIDGIRLSKARRFRYRNSDMDDLETKLNEAAAPGKTPLGNIASGKIMIATDGVFSMDGYIANLPAICDLADNYRAMVMVDDSHAVGFIGANGRGTHEHHGVMGRVDVITGTLGKALGGASGGYSSGRKEIVELLRQRSRPYLFSNSLAPAIAGASLKVLDLLAKGSDLRERLRENTRFFRERITALGFDILPGEHPIIPVMLGDAKVAGEMAERLLKCGVYVVAFSYPVVPEGRARIRTQISAGHSREDLEFAVQAFAKVKREMGL